MKCLLSLMFLMSFLNMGMGAVSALAAGDAARGFEISKSCRACHGETGRSSSQAFPIIGGQHEKYIHLALQAYKNKTRDNVIMMAPLVDLSPQDLEDVAAYYAAQDGLGEGPMDSPAAGPSAPQRDDSMPMFASLLARAAALDAEAVRSLAKYGKPSCTMNQLSTSLDADKDGLQDAYDAAPNDAGEFVVDGNGDGKFELCSIQQLQAILTLGDGAGSETSIVLDDRMGRDYQIAADIDASSMQNYQPLGDCGPKNNCMINLDRSSFQGTIDGRGYTISNLTISRPDKGGTSLIGVLGRQGVLLNMTLKNVDIEGKGGVGGLVGSSFGMVYNAHVEGAIKAKTAAGGIVGGSAGLVAYSHAKVTVSGETALGGVVGDMNGAVFYSTSDANITGQWGLGGLVGLNTYGKILHSAAAGTVTGEVNTGGLVGINTDAMIFNSSSSANVTNTSQNAGGLVGFNSLSTIMSSYATGTVSGAYAVGGLAGTNNGLIKNSYALGAVSGEDAVGGLVGVRSQGAEIDSYWDTAQTGQKVAAGDDDGPLSDPGTRFGPAPIVAAYGASNSKGMTTANLTNLDGSDSGWLPAKGLSSNLLANYCDLNRNGFTDFAERLPTNTVWNFGSETEMPKLQCNMEPM
jgi:cytochrome c553